jgi:hypothetical protein
MPIEQMLRKKRPSVWEEAPFGMSLVVHVLDPSDVDWDGGLFADDRAGAVELFGARDQPSEVATRARVKDAERDLFDLFVEAGLHDAVDDLAVCAVAAKRDDRPRSVRDGLPPDPQAVSPRLRQLKVDGPEMPGHGIRNDEGLTRIKHRRRPRTAFRVFRVE